MSIKNHFSPRSNKLERFARVCTLHSDYSLSNYSSRSICSALLINSLAELESDSARLTDGSTWYSPVSMTKNESLSYFGHPCVPQRIWLPQPGERLKQKDWKPRGQSFRGQYYV